MDWQQRPQQSNPTMRLSHVPSWLPVVLSLLLSYVALLDAWCQDDDEDLQAEDWQAIQSFGAAVKAETAAKEANEKREREEAEVAAAKAAQEKEEAEAKAAEEAAEAARKAAVEAEAAGDEEAAAKAESRLGDRTLSGVVGRSAL